MRFIRAILAYPAILLVPVTGVVVFLRVPPGERLEMFALGAMATIGGTELALAAVALSQRRSRLTVAARTVTGVGAVAVGAIMNSGSHPILLSVAFVVFAVGVALSTSVPKRV